jgi:uncharacterized membrane protein YtjA (UPF0391 family)
MYRLALGLSVVFLAIALLAGLLGFAGIAGFSWGGVRIFFFVFLVLAVLAFVGGFFVRRRRSFWDG